MATSEKVYFPSVRIKGFKAIDDLNLNSLARINLIAGDNNVGKSTLINRIISQLTGVQELITTSPRIKSFT